MTSFQPPNVEADPAPPILSRGTTISSAAFAREASAYTRYLRRAYRERLLAGDDAGVASVAHAARVVERAAVVHASALTLSSVRGRTHDDPAAAADVAAAKSYLIGVQTRLADALRARDVHTLDRVADAAEAAMHALAHPNDAFADISDLPLTTPEHQHQSTSPADFDGGEYDPNSFEEDTNRSQTSIISQMFPWMGVSGVSNSVGKPAKGGKRRGCCGFFSALSTTDRVVIIVYLLMLAAALVAVGFITAQFVDGIKNPGSFLRPRTSDSLPVPVVTLCLSQSAVPFSRFQLFNYTDAVGRSFGGTYPTGDYKESISPEFDRTVERFWDNPDNESCKDTVGDYFPFPTKSLNDIAAGKKSSRCKPCYRMGSKVAVQALSTNFNSSSSILAFTDNYFLECLKRPGGLSDKSMAFLHELTDKKYKEEGNDLASFNVLSRADNGSLTELDKSAFAKLTKPQLCNVFYFGLFPKQLGRLAKNDAQIRYVYDNGIWVNQGQGPEFVPPVEKPESNFFPLESLQFFVSSNSTTDPGSLNGQRDMALIGPNTQTYASFRPLEVYNESRFDVQTSTSNFIHSDVAPLFGYWLSYRIFYNYNRFITDVYYQESTYSFSQWFIDFTGYLSLFTGASIFSVFLLPILYSVRMRQRKKLRSENPEAYFWSKYRKKFGLTRFTPGGPAMERGTSSAVRENEERNVQLPGYNV